MNWFTTEGLFEEFIERWPEWDLFQQPLNAVQMLEPTELSGHELIFHSELPLYSYSNFIICWVSHFISAFAFASRHVATFICIEILLNMCICGYIYIYIYVYIIYICSYLYMYIYVLYTYIFIYISGFYPSTFIYSCFSPKIEFCYCLHENAFVTYFLALKHAFSIADKHLWILWFGNKVHKIPSPKFVHKSW